jgi:hypothetical protein
MSALARVSRRCPHGMEIGVVICEHVGCVASSRKHRITKQEVKQCTGRCRAMLPAEDFYARPDGVLRGECKKCHNRRRSESNVKR